MVDQRKRTSKVIHPNKNDWKTPTRVFRQIEALLDIKFDLDPCAAADNHLKLPIYYTEKDNGLTKPWAPHKFFCNPPFEKKNLFLKKAISETHRGAEGAVLLEAQTDAAWFHELASQGYIHLILHRINFMDAMGHTNQSGMRGHCIIHFVQSAVAPSQLVTGITLSKLADNPHGLNQKTLD